MNMQFKSKASANGGIICGGGYGPCFGNMYFGFMNLGIVHEKSTDIRITNNSDRNDSSSTVFPKNYSNNGVLQQYCLNEGRSKFTVSEIEVFLVE
jgi:hypothetical protein